MVKRIPPLAGPEKDTLLVSINRHRDVVLWKLQGLDDEQVRRPLTPSGTNLLSLVKHLAYVEYGWFCGTFGRETEPLGDPENDLTVGPDETTADIVALYGRARAAADLAVNEVGLDGLGTSWDGETVSMRWVLVHMIEETTRHAGHMDIVRELIDGATGDYA
ncbi:DinB family protein [Streptomyces sp. NBC_01465]|uniref:DinB family protein n=1 Tax=Streptomyces sp. NBC_01465 TaxID=2903878 RepID=UPI002E30ECDA|nr:DinB family protein [Streptomyces sp. NBC_01465]